MTGSRVSSYIICATPRSGSTLLCDLLTATGMAGAPNSFYRELSMPYWVETWGVTEPMDSPDFDRVYLEAALDVGRAGTSLFGLRQMWNGVAPLSDRLKKLFPGLEKDAARFAAAFGHPVYFHLSRADKLAQAISRYRAEEGGLWHVNADGSERERTKRAPVGYDHAGIAGNLAEVEEDERHWHDWFDRNGITPHRIVYEDLASRPAEILAGILSALGLDPALARTVQPRTRKLADAESRLWAERFRADAGMN